MTAQEKYITSLLSVFSTFLESLSVSNDLALLTTEKFVVFITLRAKSDKNWNIHWSVTELEKYITAQNIPHKSAVLMRKFITNYTPFEVDVYLHEFLTTLKSDARSNSTIKNYRSDIQQFAQTVNVKEIKELFKPEHIKAFVHTQLKSGLKLTTVKRKLSSITQFALWAETQNIVADASFWISDLDSIITKKPFQTESSTHSGHSETTHSKTATEELADFLLNLEVAGNSESTIKNYKSDIHQFLEFSTKTQLQEIITQAEIEKFATAQKKAGLKATSIKRKLSSITQFALWAEARGRLHKVSYWITQLPEQLFTTTQVLSSETKTQVNQVVELKLKPNTLIHAYDTPVTPNRPSGWSLPVPKFAQAEANKTKSTTPVYSGIKSSLQEFAHQINTKRNKQFLPYLNLAMMLLFIIGLGILGYQQFISQAPTPFAYPSTPVRPNRELSFQGRLTDTAQNPITATTDMAFRLYDTGPGTGGSQLWTSGTCAVTPDQDGIFNVGLGDDCGSEITQDVFTENSNVWLEVEIETETLTPRQSIKTVAYALNSETVQGYPISATGAATINTILTMDAGGQVLLGEVAPSLKATSGSFSIEAQTLTLQTSAGSNGNILLSPDGTGTVIVQSDLNLEGYLHAPGATLSATYTGGTALFLNAAPLSTANIMEWVDANGGGGSIDYNGNIGIGTTTLNAKLSVDGAIRSSSLSAGGLVKAAGTTGELEIATAGTDYEVPLTFENGLTRSTNTIRLGGTLTQNTDIPLAGYNLSFTGIGKIGIGTTTPVHKLEVNSAQTGKALVLLKELGDQDILAASNSAGQTRFRMANTGYLYAERFSDVSNDSYFLDPAGGTTSMAVLSNVGIGTTTPGARLDVRNSSTEDILNLFDGASEVLTVIDGGNVGIGSITPSSKLDVNGQITGGFGAAGVGGTLDWDHVSNSKSGNGYTLLQGSATNGPSAAGGNYFHPMNFEYNSKNGTGNVTQLAIPYGNDPSISAGIYMRGSYSAVWGNWVKIISEDTTGNVGIGLNTPSHKLELVSHTTAAGGLGFGTDTELYRSAANTLALASGDSFNIVSGSLQMAGTNVITSGRLFLGADGTDAAPAFSFSADSNNGMYRITTDTLGFSTASTERIRIDASGNIGIGTTTTTTAKLESVFTPTGLDQYNTKITTDTFGASERGASLFVTASTDQSTPGSHSADANVYIGRELTGNAYDSSFYGIDSQVTKNGTATNYIDTSVGVRGLSTNTGAMNLRDGVFPGHHEYVNGVYGQLSGTWNEYGSGVGSYTLSAILGINSATGTAKSYAGYFSGDVTLESDFKLLFDSDQIGANTYGDSYITYNSANSSLDFYEDGSQSIVIKSANVGIGTTNPLSKLQVHNTSTEDIFNAYDGMTEVFTIMDGGNVGIGSTGAAGARLAVTTNTTSDYVAEFFNDGNATTRWGIMVQAGVDDHTAVSTSTLIQFKDGNGTNTGSITFGSSATAYNTTSDARLKQNITESSKGLEELLQIKIHDYSYIADSANTMHTGYLAQQLYEIYPDAVTAYLDDPNEMWQVDYGKVTPLIIKAVQEQQAQINQLSLLTNSISISNAGQLLITNSNGNYVVTQTQQGVINSIGGFAEAVIGKIRAGLVTTQELVVTNTASITNLTVQSLKVGGQTLENYVVGIINNQNNNNSTQLVSPIAGDLVVDSVTTEDITATGSSTLGSLLAQDVVVTNDITVQGDASISGTLLAGIIESDALTTQEATVAGTLQAETIISDHIEATSTRISALEAGIAQLEHVRATTAELMTATVSGTLYANNIYDFENKIATTLQQPGLLDTILGNYNNTTTQDNLDDLYATVNKTEFAATAPHDIDLSLAELNTTTNDTVITGTALFIQQYFKVNGAGYISDSLAIGESLFIGENMQIADGYIQYTTTDPSSQILKIQPEGQGSIELLAGLLTLDESGKVIVNGDFEVTGNAKIAGTLLTNMLKPTDFGNPLQVQVAGVDTQTNEVKRSRFEIINEVGTPVATFSAQGNAAFAGTVDISGKANIAGGLGIDSQDLGSSDTNELTTDKSSGKATIKSGANEVTINSNLITQQSLVYVTAVGSTGNQVLYVKSQTAENIDTPDQEGKFVVGFDNPAASDVSFNWWIVN